MSIDFSGKLVVGISSRALFNLDESHQIYLNDGFEAYAKYQRANEHKVLEPGYAFPLVQKFLKLNHDRKPEDARVEVIMLSRNTADTGLRIFNSIKHHNLNITRAAFTGGKSPYVYAKAFGSHLYLSLNHDDVKQALNANCPAASIWSGKSANSDCNSLNIAFDGDAVLFSDESERVYKEHGLDAFNKNEIISAKRPLQVGPFKGFLEALHKLQADPNLPITIRTALVTARSAPAHERVIHTLRQWNIRVDESMFLGWVEKVDFLESFQPDIFFVDQKSNLKMAAPRVASAHVPYGVANRS